jgi:protein O-GlcNAc transferase
MDSAVLLSLAIAARKSGNLAQSLVYLEQAIAINPKDSRIYFLHGLTLEDLNRLDEAIASLKSAIRVKPDYAEAYNNIGIILHDQKRFNEAISNFYYAIRYKLDYAQAYNNLGSSLRAHGDPVGAQLQFEQAVRLQPDYALAYYNLGQNCMDLGQLEQAEINLSRAIHLKPYYFDALRLLGMTLEKLCRLPKAIDAYQAALKLCPKSTDIYNSLGNALTNHCQLDQAVEAYRQALLIRPDYYQVHSNLLVCLNYNSTYSNQEIFAEHLAWNFRHALHLADEIQPHQNIPDHNRRLRVGYVSPSFGRGAVRYFLQALLDQHHKEVVETYAYTTLSLSPELFQETSAFVTVLRDVSAFGDAEFAEQVRADGIDILVDLSGHTPGHRLMTFAQKPAPVQVSWLDYFNTTGLDSMDYLISDEMHTPPQTTQRFTEQLALLPHCRLCYTPPVYVPEVVESPFIKNGYIVFGCFNRLSKLTQQGIALWCKILHVIPGSKLVLKSHSLNDPASWPEYHALFAIYDIAPQRVELRGASLHQEMLKEYGDIDIALDPFPYNGGLTTCEALWMGVPVITLAGDRMISRQSASLLAAAGLEQFIANDPTEYIGIAQTWASNPERLANLRQTLRQRVSTSPLCNNEQFARDMEKLYRNMWRQWCDKQPSINQQRAE